MKPRAILSEEFPASSDLILEAVPAQEFFAHYFGKAPGSFSSPAADWLHVITLDEVDPLVASLAIPDRNWIFVVKKGAAIAQEKLTTSNGYIDLNVIYEAYRAGYSLQLAKVHRRHGAIGRLSRALECQMLDSGVALVRDVSAHLYLTPPLSTGLPPHYDNHDVFVLQIEGVKHWRIYNEGKKFPISRQTTGIKQELVPPIFVEVTAEPGNVLYIPRGWFHEATAGDTHSLHLTLSVCSATFLDLLVPMLEEHPELRAPLPPAEVRGPDFARAISQQISRSVSQLTEGVGFSGRVEDTYDRMFEKMDTLPDCGFRNVLSAAPISLETVVRRAQGAHAEIRVGDGESDFCFAGNRLSAPDQAAAAFEFISSTKQFSVGAIPSGIDDHAKVRLVQELLRLGFLRTV